MRYSVNQQIGHYRIVDFIGAGGMGEVYRAIQDSINRVVALKFLTHPDQSGELTARFENEARIHSGIRHPNIALLHDFFEYERTLCIVMEFVPGRGLEEVIEDGLNLTEAALIFKQIVNAVTYLHSEGVLHRDIKPGNVRISADGSIKLLDFGIAKDALSTNLTKVDAFTGTDLYSAPERIAGKPANEQTDIWALGVLFYEMLTGTTPFQGESLIGLLEDIRKKN